MSLKVAAVSVALLAITVMYLHEYHSEKVHVVNNIPIIKRSLATIHSVIVDISHRLKYFSKHENTQEDSEKVFSAEEISKFNGEEDSRGIYLAILGKVYDVSKGIKHYGPGGSYHVFAGKDASRAFVTGDFSDSGVTDDVTGLSPEELKSIQDWSLFYHKEYTYKGKLVGRFYTANGDRTDFYKEVASLIKQAEDRNAAQNADYLKYPPCNVEWTPESGSKVWCSNQSGGIERDWAGVPRKYYKPGSDSYRCACIQYTSDMKKVPHKQRSGNVEEYEDCASDSDSCYVKTDV